MLLMDMLNGWIDKFSVAIQLLCERRSIIIIFLSLLGPGVQHFTAVDRKQPPQWGCPNAEGEMGVRMAGFPSLSPDYYGESLR